jgi:hypothetical protein
VEVEIPVLAALPALELFLEPPETGVVITASVAEADAEPRDPEMSVFSTADLVDLLGASTLAAPPATDLKVEVGDGRD